MWPSTKVFLSVALLLSQPLWAEVDSFPINPSQVKGLTQKIFPDTLRVSCRTLSRGPKSELGDFESVGPFVKKTIEHLQNEEWTKLVSLFHPLVRGRDDLGEKIAATFRHKYEKPWQFSVYREWAIHTVNGDPLEVPCDDGALTVTSRYSYPLQFAVWLQVMGSNEIGRVFMIVVPGEKDWRIAAWHISQWSHQGKDAAYWAKDAGEANAKGDKVAASIKYDVAQKLLDVGKLLFLNEREKLSQERDKIMAKAELLSIVNKTLKTDGIVYTASILAEDGAGLSIRERIKVEEPTHDLMRRCIQRGKTLISGKVLSPALGGLRCSYVLPQEPAESDGQLGGFFYTQKELIKKDL